MNNKSEKMICSKGICLLQNSLNQTGLLTEIVSYLGDQRLFLPFLGKFYIHNPPIVGGLASNILYRKMTQKNKIIVSNLSKWTTKVFVRLKSESSLNADVSSVEINAFENDSFLFQFPLIPQSLKTGVLEISFNGIHYFVAAEKIQIIENPEITFIQNPLYSFESFAFSFIPTNLLIKGANFLNSSNVLVKIQNEFNTFYLPKESIKFVSSTSMELIAPVINSFITNLELSYPIQMKLGISFNDGVEFVEKDLSYVDKYSDLTIFTIFPNLVYEKPYNLTLQGFGFFSAKFCRFVDSSNSSIVYAKSSTQPSAIPSIISCELPTLKNLARVKVLVENTFGDLSSGIEIVYIAVPVISQLIPNHGKAIGGYQISIKGSNFSPNYLIYCKFDQIECTDPCQFISSSEIKCPVQSYPNERMKFSISYSKEYWISFDQDFIFESCEPGFTSKSYISPCESCIKGTHKPIAGFFDCLNCSIGSYTDQINSSACIQCPSNTTTTTSQDSPNSCVCKSGFYNNPDPIAKTNKKCLECPVGGICGKFYFYSF
jgi:hypothetical protein